LVGTVSTTEEGFAENASNTGATGIGVVVTVVVAVALPALFVQVRV
jgi:hypothetical protein